MTGSSGKDADACAQLAAEARKSLFTVRSP
jgi:hypothetical protein